MSESAHPDTPNIPSSSAVLRIQSSTVIDAPIDRVWETLTDTSSYRLWNRFVPRVTVRSQPTNSANHNVDNNNDDGTLKLGTRFTFHVNMYPETSAEPQPEQSGLQDTFLEVIECSPPAASSGAASDAAEGSRKARIVWASDAPASGFVMGSLLSAERVHELVEVEDPQSGRRMTEMRNWESQVGALAYVVRGLFGERLKGNFEIWSDGLKGFAEGSR